MSGGIDLEAEGLCRHAPPGQRFALALPRDWHVHLDSYTDVPLVGVTPEPDAWGFRTNVVVTVERLDQGTTVESWQASADQVLPTTLNDYLLLDLQPAPIGEHTGLRRLAHHDAGGRAVTMEQWTVLDAGCGFTLTASTSTLAYPAVADRFAQIAETFGVAADLTPSQAKSGG